MGYDDMALSCIRKNRHERGTVSIEMAFILPLLMLVVWAIVELGLAFGRYQILINAAHQGADAASVAQTPCNAGVLTTAGVTQAQTAFAGLGLQPGQANVTVTGACGIGNVQVTVDFQHPTPLLNRFSLAQLPPAIQLSYTATRSTEVPNP